MKNKIIAWLRQEGRAGQYLRKYERERYTYFDMAAESIIVPSDAEELADVSFWQAGMNWTKYPHRSAIIRVGQNVWKDTSFETFYADARTRGIVLGGYFFWDDRATPEAQFDVIKQAMAGKHFELEIYIDVERFYGGAYGHPRNIRKLIELVEAAGIRCKEVGIYTGYYFWKDNIYPHLTADDKAFFAARPLDIAWYASPSLVQIPPPWTKWNLWQWGTPVIDWGQPTKEIDANKSCYSKSEFEIRYLGGTTPPDEQEAGMFELKPLSWVRVRASHPDAHILGSGLDVINSGEIGKADAKYTYPADKYVSGVLRAKAGDVWYHVSETGGRVVDGWAAEIHLGVRYCNVTDVTPPEPEPVVTEDVTVTIRRDGWSDLVLTGKQEKL